MLDDPTTGDPTWANSAPAAPTAPIAPKLGRGQKIQPMAPSASAAGARSASIRPTRNSRHFDDKPSFVEADDYSSSRSKSHRSTDYTTPLSFGDQTDLSYRPLPLTRANLDALHHRLSDPLSLQSPPSISVAASDTRSYVRRKQSPTKSSHKFGGRKAKDENLHPLNLPPDELRRLSARMAQERRDSTQQDIEMPDADEQTSMNGTASSPQSPGPGSAPGAFPSDEPNGTATNGVKGAEGKSPTPPPHRNLPQVKADPEACKAAGNKYFKAKDYDRAVQEYTKAVEAAPSNATYWSNRAAAYMSASKFDSALGDALQAVRLDNNNDKFLHRLARVYTSLGRPEDALDTYAKIKDASATDTAAARKAVQSIGIAEKTINDPDGNGNMALWNIDQAKQTLGFGTPTPRKWQILRAKAYLKMATPNALGEVQAIAQSLMRENSMDAEALVLAGRSFYLKDEKGVGKSDYQRAEECFRQALNSDPDLADARNILRTMKKLERSKNEANDLYKRGRYAEAIPKYTDALTIDPSNKITNAKLLGNRAMANMKLKNYDEARNDCDQALKLDSSYTKAKRTRAKAVGEAGDWDQAVKDLKSLVEDNQGDVELQKELRNAELELKKSQRKDYYKILGVSKDAGDKEIERAYKKKATVLHPDKTQGDKKKEEEFKDCLEAKETLLDPQKRHVYDTGADLMEPGMGGMGGFPGGFGGMGGMGGMGGGGVQIDPEVLFNMMGGMGGMGGGRGGGGGGGMPHFSFSTGGGGGGGGRGGFPF